MTLIDNYDRIISYMRVSVTDRCNLHCSYCRPRNGQVADKEELLTLEETLKICAAASGLGVKVFKITGGEPLLREGCVDFMARLKELQGVEQVTLTTNGTMLEQYAPKLQEAGISLVNVSVDTLCREHYEALTGGNLDRVLAGVRAAVAAGLQVKINCVPLKLFAFDEYARLLDFPNRRK